MKNVMMKWGVVVVVVLVLGFMATYRIGYGVGQLDYAVGVLSRAGDVCGACDGDGDRDPGSVLRDSLGRVAPPMHRMAGLIGSIQLVGLDGSGDGAVLDSSGEGSGSGSVVGIPPSVPSDPVELFSMIWKAFKDGKWAWAFGLVFALLTLFFRRVYKPLAKDGPWKKAVPWVAMGLSLACALAFCLAGGGSWPAAIGSGISAGMVSIGGWELFLKKLMPNAANANAKASK